MYQHMVTFTVRTLTVTIIALPTLTRIKYRGGLGCDEQNRQTVFLSFFILGQYFRRANTMPYIYIYIVSIFYLIY